MSGVDGCELVPRELTGTERGCCMEFCNRMSNGVNAKGRRSAERALPYRAAQGHWALAGSRKHCARVNINDWLPKHSGHFLTLHGLDDLGGCGQGVPRLRVGRSAERCTHAAASPARVDAVAKAVRIAARRRQGGHTNHIALGAPTRH